MGFLSGIFSSITGSMWMYIAVGVFIVTLMGGSYFLYKQNEQLNQQLAAQQIQVTEQKQAISILETRIKIVEELKAKFDDQTAKNHAEAAQANKKLAHHDLGKISKVKPEVLEGIINQDTRQMFDSLSAISGGKK